MDLMLDHECAECATLQQRRLTNVRREQAGQTLSQVDVSVKQVAKARWGASQTSEARIRPRKSKRVSDGNLPPAPHASPFDHEAGVRHALRCKLEFAHFIHYTTILTYLFHFPYS